LSPPAPRIEFVIFEVLYLGVAGINKHFVEVSARHTVTLPMASSGAPAARAIRRNKGSTKMALIGFMTYQGGLHTLQETYPWFLASCELENQISFSGLIFSAHLQLG